MREDAARDGCIYLPQQDSNMNQPLALPSHLQQLLASKSRSKGLEDIFGAPGHAGHHGLGTGPGVIDTMADAYGGGGYGNRNGGGGAPSFEEKFNANNTNYNRDESRDYKPKRDNYDNKFAERPDFGDRFTANRNRTHPSNRGGRGGMSLGMSRSNGYDRSNGYEKNGTPHHNGDRDFSPRFKKAGGFNGPGDSAPLRPASMMLKPKTPSMLPKSAQARDEGGMLQGGPGQRVTMMTPSEPAVFISKQSSDKKRQEKKNQGPTREELFAKIDEILATLFSTGSTNEAFTLWKEGEVPSKMVNNALIHLFKQIIRRETEADRVLAFQLVDQLCGEEIITQVPCLLSYKVTR